MDTGSSAEKREERAAKVRRTSRGRVRAKNARKRAASSEQSTASGSTEQAQTAQQAVGNFLRATRAAQNLTQAQVAGLTRESPWRLSRAAVSAIERGQNFPGMEAMLALSNVLHVDPKELIERARLAAVVPVDITGVSYGELEQKAQGHFWAGEFRQAVSVYDAMVEKLALEPDGNAEERARRLAQLEVSRATALKRAGAMHAALATAERAVSLARDYPEIQARAYIVLAALRCEQGHLPLANDAAERAIELSRYGDTRLQGWAWMGKAQIYIASGRYEDSRKAYLESHRCAEIAGDRDHMSHVEGSVGLCYHAQGDLDAARDWIGRAIASARSRNQPALEARWLVDLGQVELTAGNAELADEHAEAALHIAEPSAQLLTVFRAEWLRHRILRRVDPRNADRARISNLRKLFLQLDQHQGIEEIREFRDTAMRAPAAGGGEDS